MGYIRGRGKRGGEEREEETAAPEEGQREGEEGDLLALAEVGGWEWTGLVS